MAYGLLTADRTHDASVASIPTAVDARKQKLAQMLEVKLEQGYRIESQGDTEAVLVMQGRRPWIGLFGRGEAVRQIVSIDEQGAQKTRKLSVSGTSGSARGENPLGG
jgi:hypothetical protein